MEGAKNNYGGKVGSFCHAGHAMGQGQSDGTDQENTLAAAAPDRSGRHDRRQRARRRPGFDRGRHLRLHHRALEKTRRRRRLGCRFAAAGVELRVGSPQDSASPQRCALLCRMVGKHRRANRPIHDHRPSHRGGQECDRYCRRKNQSDSTGNYPGNREELCGNSRDTARIGQAAWRAAMTRTSARRTMAECNRVSS